MYIHSVVAKRPNSLFKCRLTFVRHDCDQFGENQLAIFGGCVLWLLQALNQHASQISHERTKQFESNLCANDLIFQQFDYIN